MTLQNRSVNDWGIYETEFILDLAGSGMDGRTPNRIMADCADTLNDIFLSLKTKMAFEWREIDHVRIARILNNFYDFGATDSEGYECAAELLCDIYELSGQERKEAYCQFRYPQASKEDQIEIERLQSLFFKGNRHD